MKLPYPSKCGPAGGARQVLIVGSGAFGQGLASLAHRSGATAAYDVSMGSRKLQQGSVRALPGLENTPVRSLDEALAQADMIVLAVPATALPSIVSSYGSQLAGKVVIDVTNAMKSDYAKLGRSSPSTPDCMLDVEGKDVLSDQCGKYARTSKGGGWEPEAFSNLSAYTLLHGDTLTEHVKSVAASDDQVAAEAVADFGRALGLEMRVVQSLSYASSLEARQHPLLAAWQWPSALMFVTWLVVHIYSFIRYNYYGGSPWQSIIMWILNKSVGWVSIWGMVYTYLPGVLVCYWQLLARRPSVRLPAWFKAWMDARKQLGLLSLFTMLLHLLFSTFLWMPGYYSKLWDKTDAAVVPTLVGSKLDAFGMIKKTNVPVGLQVVFDDYNTTRRQQCQQRAAERQPPAGDATTVTNIITLRSKLNWIGESSTLVGIISGVLMGVIALTSLPSITPKMNWREWRLLQSHAAAHEDWPKMIPTITLMSTIPPMMLLLLKGLLVLPPASIMLNRVRSGKWARKDDAADPLAHTAVFAVKHN
ncbi:hypothetical protein COO60DRAFT_1644375 [Scenedesmus sp. NREL 46B-D3]|nr:hypothetical protein COO60DRAFT_1644375 [Scenedesmus sp. NREL 46B-D3]